MSEFLAQLTLATLLLGYAAVTAIGLDLWKK